MRKQDPSSAKKGLAVWLTAALLCALPGLSKGTMTPSASRARGRHLFQRHGCPVCHQTGAGAKGIGPPLFDLLGTRLQLEDRRWIVRDRAYLARKIRTPNKQISRGGFNVMPPYRDTFSKRDMRALVDYLVSLKKPRGRKRAPTTPTSRPTSRRARD